MFFRATTRDRAGDFGVSGWVRNLEDGRVEAVFEGEDETVEEMLAFCGEGPEAARVEDIDVEAEKPEGLDGFEVRR